MPTKQGRGQGQGTNLNLPLPKGTRAPAYLKALDRFCKAMRAFQPDFLIIAAGFDTHKTDPIGGFALQTPDYRKIGRRLAALDVPTLICQEGGYNTAVLGDCVHSLLSGFKD